LSLVVGIYSVLVVHEVLVDCESTFHWTVFHDFCLDLRYVGLNLVVVRSIVFVSPKGVWVARDAALFAFGSGSFLAAIRARGDLVGHAATV
jgi:hypothetical protein